MQTYLRLVGISCLCWMDRRPRTRRGSGLGVTRRSLETGRIFQASRCLVFERDRWAAQGRRTIHLRYTTDGLSFTSLGFFLYDLLLGQQKKKKKCNLVKTRGHQVRCYSLGHRLSGVFPVLVARRFCTDCF